MGHGHPVGAAGRAGVQLASGAPGRDRASHVEVTFAAAAGQTLVTLEHTGWEVFADPAAARAEYDHGWPAVLDRYREYCFRSWFRSW